MFLEIDLTRQLLQALDVIVARRVESLELVFEFRGFLLSKLELILPDVSLPPPIFALIYGIELFLEYGSFALLLVPIY